MLVPCFLAGSIVYEIVGTQAKLRSDKFDDLCSTTPCAPQVSNGTISMMILLPAVVMIALA